MTKRWRRAQLGGELMIVIGIAVLVLTYTVMEQHKIAERSRCQGEIGLARATIDAIGDQARLMHTYAVGSRTMIVGALPEGVTDLTIANRTIRMLIGCGGVGYDVYRTFPFNVTGTLSAAAGMQDIYVRSLLNEVLITNQPAVDPLGERFCGNGYKDLGEICDLRSTGNKTCVDLGYRGGVLQCDAFCLFDMSTCSVDNPPAVSLDWPPRNETVLNTTTELRCHATDDFALTGLSIWTNMSGNWSLLKDCPPDNATYAACSIETAVPRGWTTWNCFATDDIGHAAWATNASFLVTNVTPTVLDMIPIDGYSVFAAQGVLVTTLLTMKEVTPQWQAEALLGSTIRWLLTLTGNCECGTDIGACRQNTQLCEGGSWGICTGTPPINEVCNDVDDDCDGLVDEGIDCGCVNGTAEVCGSNLGECHEGNHTCSNGVWGACTGGTQPVAESCDGLDNDCDGNIDNIPPQSCGISNIGICRLGIKHCENAAWSACQGAVLPQLEVCDGIDNDCDGLVDEVNCVCQEGATRDCPTVCGAGIQTCVDGFWGVCSELAGPQPEICDGVDNNCDGQLDEGLVRPCGCDCADNRILVVLDGNHHGEDVDDVNYTLGIFDRQGINYTFMNEPSGGLTLAHTAGYDLIWFINPGWPPDTRTTIETLKALNEFGVPVVLHGDDMTWGMTELAQTDMEPLTHLRNVNNGVDRNYTVNFLDLDHPMLTYVRGRQFTYREDDIDTSVALDEPDLTVLATGYATTNPSYGGPAVSVRDTVDVINITLTCVANSSYPLTSIEIWTNSSGAFGMLGSCAANSSGASCAMDIRMGFGELVWNCVAVDTQGARSWGTNHTLTRINKDLRTYAIIAGQDTGAGGIVSAYRTDNGSQLWQYNASFIPTSIGVGDADGDGVVETFVGSAGNNTLLAIAHNGSLRWSRTANGSLATSVFLIWNNSFFWGSTDGHVHRGSAVTGDDIWSTTGSFAGNSTMRIAFGDYDKNGVPDLYVADTNSSAAFLRAYNGSNGARLFNTNYALSQRISADRLLMMDANNDGYQDAVWGANDGRVYAFNGRTGAQLWRSNALTVPVTRVALGNFTADSRPDVVFMGDLQSSIIILNGQSGAQVMAHAAANSNRYVLETGDIDRNGYSDVFFGNTTAKTITAFDGKTNLNLWSAPPTATAPALACVHDIDNDGYPDIVAYNSGFNAINGRNGTLLWNTTGHNTTTSLTIGRVSQ